MINDDDVFGDLENLVSKENKKQNRFFTCSRQEKNQAKIKIERDDIIGILYIHVQTEVIRIYPSSQGVTAMMFPYLSEKFWPHNNEHFDQPNKRMPFWRVNEKQIGLIKDAVVYFLEKER